MEYTRSGVKYSTVKCLLAIIVIAYLFEYLPYQWKQQHKLVGGGVDVEKLIENAEEDGNIELANEYRKIYSTQKEMEQRNRKRQSYATIPMLFGFICCLVVIRKILFYIEILKKMDKIESNVCYIEKEKANYKNIIYKILYFIRGY